MGTTTALTQLVRITSVDDNFAYGVNQYNVNMTIPLKMLPYKGAAYPAVGEYWFATKGDIGIWHFTGIQIAPNPNGLLSFPFTYGDKNLNEGVSFFSPKAGDWLLDAWVSTTTSWNGTTPKFDFGFTANVAGIFDLLKAPVNMEVGSGEDYTGLLSSGGSAFGTTTPPLTLLDLQSLITANATGITPRYIPAQFITNAPLYYWVSTNGQAGGTAPNASQGVATLYLMVSSSCPL